MPSTLTLVWLAISVPIVFWDAGFVLLRPHTFPGGSLHWPVWALYKIQMETDYTYGYKEWNNHGGWCAAQSVFNIIENLMYLGYLGLWYRNRAKLGPAVASTVGLTGRAGAVAALLGFSGVFLTLSKTVLYCAYFLFSSLFYWVVLMRPAEATAQNIPPPPRPHRLRLGDRANAVGARTAVGLNEAFTGFANIRHNPPAHLFFVWIIPK